MAIRTRRAAFFAGMIVLGACLEGGQGQPLQDSTGAQSTVEHLSATDPVVHEGLFTIDLTVTDAAGKPVSNLAPLDFTLIDNGHPAKIRTLHNSLAPIEPRPELIFVLDEVNLSPEQLTQTQSALVRFLTRNDGHLDFPCLLYRLTRNGLFSSLRPVTDGKLLVKELEHNRSQWTVWKGGAFTEGKQLNPLSLRALGSIAINQRDVAGHKVVVWIGPGWPVNTGAMGFDQATELSTRLREARITLDNVNVWLGSDISFDYHQYLQEPWSQADMEPGKMALPVIARHTGGLVLDSSSDLDQGIERCVQDAGRFYTLTFNPPRTETADEYHEIGVEVSRPGLIVHAPTGYYNEPVYFDLPRPEIEKITVAQLENIVHSHAGLLRRLNNVELTERLSTPRLEALLSEMHNERERQALMADADLSFALAPPADEIVNRPAPSLGEQRIILLRTYDYLQNTLPKLPDFYAHRTTDRFGEAEESDKESWKLPPKDQTLHFATGEHATVLYRNGHEVVHEKTTLAKQSPVRGVRTGGLETWGTFGPILAYVWQAAANSGGTLTWKRWERGRYGDVAVFAYRGASPNVGPDITYCCLAQGNGSTPYQSKTDTYGEFAVNPDTGAIMRIVTNADLDEERDPDVPLIRSQIMVEYGPVELGGKTYICPLRSAEVSRGRTIREIHEWGMVFRQYGAFQTLVNDVTFSGYHKFGSTFRILPDFEVTDDPTPSPAPPKAH